MLESTTHCLAPNFLDQLPLQQIWLFVESQAVTDSSPAVQQESQGTMAEQWLCRYTSQLLS